MPMEKEMIVAGVDNAAPVPEYLVTDKKKARKKIKGIDVIAGLSLLLVGAALAVAMLALYEWDIGTIFDLTVGTDLMAEFLRYIAVAVIGIFVLILGACGCRNGVNAFTHFFAFAVCVLAAVDVSEGLDFSNLVFSDPQLIYAALFALGALFCLIAFFISLAASRKIGTNVTRTCFLILGFLPSFAFYASSFVLAGVYCIADFVGAIGGTITLTLLIWDICYMVALVFGIIAIAYLFVGWGMRLLDRTKNVDSLRRIETTYVTTPTGEVVPAEPAPRKKVIWVGRRRG